MFYGLQKVNTVTLSNKKASAGKANICFIAVGPAACCFTKYAFNYARFPVTFQTK